MPPIIGESTHVDARLKALTQYFRSRYPNIPIWWSEFYSHSPAQMQTARATIAQHQRPGDIALWWAERRYPWGK